MKEIKERGSRKGEVEGGMRRKGSIGEIEEGEVG